MNKYALITGGASGLGKDLAGLFAKDGINLFLVSSNIKNLEAAKAEFEKEYKVDIHILAVDLSDNRNFYKVKEYTDANKLEIQYLVNCAGFGDQCDFKDMDIDKQIRMVELNCNAPMYLMRAYINEMLNSKEDCHILNIASIASFFPGPHMCTYHSTKAFLLNISEAIEKEIRGTNVYLTTVCPGPFESGFVSKAHNDYTFSKFKVLPSLKVAEVSYKQMLKKKTLYVFGSGNRMNNLLTRFVPRKMVVNVSATKIKGK